MKKLLNKLFLGYLYFCLLWVHLALAFQITMIVLSFSNPELEKRIGNELTWALDGRFKN
jgi:hypothetical protein